MLVKSLITPLDAWINANIDGVEYVNKYMIPPAIMQAAVKNYHITGEVLEVITA